MPKMTPQQIAAKWPRGMQGASESIKAGVQSVTTAPTQLAAAAVDRYAAGVRKAVDDGTYVAGCQAVSLTDWQQSMVNKGIPNLQNGIKQGTNATQQFMTAFMPYADQVSQEVASMPKGTLQNSIDRAAKAITMLRNFKYRR